MRPYSKSVRLCSRTSCGVIGGPPPRVGALAPGPAPEHGAKHTGDDVGLGVGDQALGLAGVEPQPVAVGTLVDLDPVPLPGDQVVAALGALHVMRPALGLRRRLLRAGALLAQQLGVAPGEVFLFVAARLIGHRWSSLVIAVRASKGT